MSKYFWSLYVTEFITLLRFYNYVDMIQSMNCIVCCYNLLCLKNNMTKKSNLMILDNSGRDYSRMLLFVFVFMVYCKIEPNSRTSGNTSFTTWLQSCHVKMWHHRTQFGISYRNWSSRSRFFKNFFFNNIIVLTLKRPKTCRIFRNLQ